MQRFSGAPGPQEIRLTLLRFIDSDFLWTDVDPRLRGGLVLLQNWSFAFDMRIIVMTISSGLIDRNAY